MTKIYYSFLLVLMVQLVAAQSKIIEPLIWLNKDLKKDANSTKSNYFNFNPVFFSVNQKEYSYKGINSKTYSLFAAFKSDLIEEVELINIKDRKEQVLISNKKLSNGNEIVYQKVDTKQGLVLTYLRNLVGRGARKGTLNLTNLSRTNTEEGHRTDLLELLYFPRMVEALEKQKIETYLSIKYGISLLGEVDYINYEGEKIWDAKKQKSFNHRVTGIGRDDFFNLNQKQSGNAQKDGLYIALKTIKSSNAENKADMPDKFFFVWGDNNGELTFVADNNKPGDLKKMNRIWSTQFTNKNVMRDLTTQVMVDKTAFLNGEKTGDSSTTTNTKPSDKKEDFVWLAIDRSKGEIFDYQNADYYLQSSDGEGYLFFNNVAWDIDGSGSDSFTFVKGPEFFVNYAVSNTNCINDELGAVDIKIVGGQPPYKIDVTHVLETTSFTTDEKSYVLSNLTRGDYLLNASDRLQRAQIDTLSVNGIQNVTVTLAPEWSLRDSKEVVIIPTIENPEQQKLNFVWKQKGRTVSTEMNYVATEQGDYSLLTTNEIGCQNEVFFRIIDDQGTSKRNWMLYPNPTQMDKPFTVKFNLEKEANVRVSIFDFAHKLIKTVDLGKVKEYSYSETISFVGSYLLVVTINGDSESAKIIIE